MTGRRKLGNIILLLTSCIYPFNQMAYADGNVAPVTSAASKPEQATGVKAASSQTNSNNANKLAMGGPAALSDSDSSSPAPGYSVGAGGITYGVNPSSGAFSFSYPLINAPGPAGSPLGVSLSLSYNSGASITAADYTANNNYGSYIPPILSLGLDTVAAAPAGSENGSLEATFLSNSGNYGVAADGKVMPYYKLQNNAFTSYGIDTQTTPSGQKYCNKLTSLNGSTEYFMGGCNFSVVGQRPVGNNLIEKDDRFGNKIIYTWQYIGTNNPFDDANGSVLTQIKQVSADGKDTQVWKIDYSSYNPNGASTMTITNPNGIQEVVTINSSENGNAITSITVTTGMGATNPGGYTTTINFLQKEGATYGNSQYNIYNLPSSISYPSGLIANIGWISLPFYQNQNGKLVADHDDLYAVSEIDTTDQANRSLMSTIKYFYGRDILHGPLGEGSILKNTNNDFFANYTGWSFLGNHYALSTSSLSDPLADSGDGNFAYSTYQEVVGPTPSQDLYTAYTYNALGLLTSKSTYGGSSEDDMLGNLRISQSYYYLAKDGGYLSTTDFNKFSDEPAKFQLPVKVDTTFNNTLLGLISANGNNFPGNVRTVSTYANYNDQGQETYVSAPIQNGSNWSRTFTYYGPSITGASGFPQNLGYGLPIASVSTSATPSESHGNAVTYSYVFGNNNGEAESQVTIKRGVLHNPNTDTNADYRGQNFTTNFKDISDETLTYDQDGRVVKSVVSPGAYATSLKFDTNVQPLETDYSYGNAMQGNPDCGFDSSCSYATTYTVTTTVHGIGLSGRIETITTKQVIDQATGNVLVNVDGNGNTRYMSYDASGRLTQVTAPNGKQAKFQYTVYSDGSHKNSVTVIAPNGYEVEKDYSGQGQLLSIADNSNSDHSINADQYPNTLLLTNTYNTMGQLTESTNGISGLSTYYYYDNLGRRVKVANPDGTADITHYADAGLINNNQTAVLSTVEGKNGEYGPWDIGLMDNSGALIQKMVAPSSAVSGISLDLSNASTWPNTTYTYNDLGEVTTTITSNIEGANGKGQVTSLTAKANYNALGLPSSGTISDNLGNQFTKSATYNYLGEVINDSQSQTIVNAGLDKTSTINGETKAYNNLGELEQITSPNNQTERFNYDADGNLIFSVDWALNAWVNTYNNMGQLTDVVEAPNVNGSGKVANVHYDYDSMTGNLVHQCYTSGLSCAAGQNEISYGYYGDGLPESITYPGNKTISYAYNALEQLQTLTDAAGGQTTYSYNNIGQLTGANITTAKGTTAGVSYTYDDFGNLKAANQISGTSANYSYDMNTGLGLSEESITNYQQSIEDLQYQHDNLGNIVSVTGTTGMGISNGNFTNTYQYDWLNRLIESSYSAATGPVNHTYGYDAANNMLTDSGSNGNNSYAYNLINQLISTNGNANIQYDNGKNGNGNMTNIPVPQGYYGADYNDLSQLTRYGADNYTYYPDGSRASKTDGSSTINYYYGLDGSLLNEIDNQGDIASYLIGLGREARILNQKNQENVNYYLYDGRGSAIATFPKFGGQVNGNFLNAYDDYGQVLIANASQTQYAKEINMAYDPFLSFNGEYTDSENGFQPLGNGYRYYNPNNKGFISKDSYSLFNRYDYADGNPIMNVDPSGHMNQGISNMLNEAGNPLTQFGLQYEYDPALNGGLGLTGFSQEYATAMWNGMGLAMTMADPIQFGLAGGSMLAGMAGDGKLAAGLGYAAMGVQVLGFAAGAFDGIGGDDLALETTHPEQSEYISSIEVPKSLPPASAGSAEEEDLWTANSEDVYTAEDDEAGLATASEGYDDEEEIYSDPFTEADEADEEDEEDEPTPVDAQAAKPFHFLDVMSFDDVPSAMSKAEKLAKSAGLSTEKQGDTLNISKGWGKCVANINAEFWVEPTRGVVAITISPDSRVVTAGFGKFLDPAVLNANLMNQGYLVNSQLPIPILGGSWQ